MANNESSMFLVSSKKTPNDNDSDPQLTLLLAPTSPYNGLRGPLFLDLLLFIAVGEAILLLLPSCH
jgi:hypothetical protein